MFPVKIQWWVILLHIFVNIFNILIHELGAHLLFYLQSIIFCFSWDTWWIKASTQIISDLPPPPPPPPRGGFQSLPGVFGEHFEKCCSKVYTLKYMQSGISRHMYISPALLENATLFLVCITLHMTSSVWGILLLNMLLTNVWYCYTLEGSGDTWVA